MSTLSVFTASSNGAMVFYNNQNQDNNLSICGNTYNIGNIVSVISHSLSNLRFTIFNGIISDVARKTRRWKSETASRNLSGGNCCR